MTFFADEQCHPQTIAVVKTRCEALGIEVVVGDATSADLGDACIGVLWQYPNTRGDVVGDAAGVSARAHAAGALSVVAADPLALTLLPAPGTFGADICVGSMQRYGVPMGCRLSVKSQLELLEIASTACESAVEPATPSTRRVRRFSSSESGFVTIRPQVRRPARRVHGDL